MINRSKALRKIMYKKLRYVMSAKTRIPHNRKHFFGLCPQCQKQTAMVLLHRDKAKGIFKLSCESCAAISTFPKDRILRTGRILTEDEAETRQQALSQVVNYSAQKTYWRGQKIRHKKFDDTGIVMSKEKTDGDHNIIIVKFENVGQKKLVEDCMAAA